MKPIQKVIVLGGGSAGLLAAITLKRHAPTLDVVVVRSKEIGVIGVGEGSTVGFPRYLHTYLAIDPTEFYRLAQPSWKLGLRFVSWGPREQFHYSFAVAYTLQWPSLRKPPGYYCDEQIDYANLHMALMAEDRVFLRGPGGLPRITHDFSYHIENRHFVDFLEGHAAKIGVALEDETVENVECDEEGVASLRLASGRSVSADLYVDSSGFASVLLGRDAWRTVPELSLKPVLRPRGRRRLGARRTRSSSRTPASRPWMPAGAGRSSTSTASTAAMSMLRTSSATTRPSANSAARIPKVGPTRVVRFKSGRLRARLGEKRGGDRQRLRVCRAARSNVAWGHRHGGRAVGRDVDRRRFACRGRAGEALQPAPWR